MKTSTNVTAFRQGSKRQLALEIFKGVDAFAENRRQLVLAEFQSQLGMEETTAATYYANCVAAIEQEQAALTERVISKNTARKFSAVKAERGSDGVIGKLAVFTNKKQAEEYSALLNYDQVLPGVAQIGKKLG